MGSKGRERGVEERQVGEIPGNAGHRAGVGRLNERILPAAPAARLAAEQAFFRHAPAGTLEERLRARAMEILGATRRARLREFHYGSLGPGIPQRGGNIQMSEIRS